MIAMQLVMLRSLRQLISEELTKRYCFFPTFIVDLPMNEQTA